MVFERSNFVMGNPPVHYQSIAQLSQTSIVGTYQGVNAKIIGSGNCECPDDRRLMRPQRQYFWAEERRTL